MFTRFSWRYAAGSLEFLVLVSGGPGLPRCMLFRSSDPPETRFPFSNVVCFSGPLTLRKLVFRSSPETCVFRNTVLLYRFSFRSSDPPETRVFRNAETRFP